MTASTPSKLVSHLESALSHRLAVRVVLAFATFLVAWPAIFSTLALYDDEGYIMMTLQTYLHGHRLYGETHTQYGPAFYFITAPVHSLLNWPLTQTGVRIKTILIWSLSVWSVQAIVLRMSGSRIAAIGTALFALLHLDKLTLEPGHPQEITLGCTLLVLFLFTRSMYVSMEVRPSFLALSSWTIAGFIVGILGLVKLNCGVVIAIPLLVTAALQSSQGRRAWWLLISVAVGPALLVAWLSRTHLGASLWALWLATCSALLIRYSVSQEIKREGTSSLRYLIGVVAGGLLAVGLVVTLAIFQGSSAKELWFGLVGQHSDFADFFFRPIGFSASAFFGLVLAIAALSIRSIESLKDIAKLVLWATVAILIAFTAAMPLEHGMHARGAGLFLAWAAPGWIVWFWRKEVSRSPKKLMLGLVAILSPLIAFPVSGTQVQIGTLPALIVVGILLGEYLVFIAKQQSLVGNAGFILDYVTVKKWMAVGALCTFASVTVVHWVRYAKGQPLGLPGSAFMRLPESIASEQKAIAKAIVESNASHLLFEGTNHNRFYFWTGVKPFTAANPTFWPVMLTDEERRQLAGAISREKRFCVVRVPNYEWLYFDKASEIRDQIKERWEPSETIGEWQVGIVH